VIDTAGVDKETGEIRSHHFRPSALAGFRASLAGCGEEDLPLSLEFVRGGQILKQFPQAGHTGRIIYLLSTTSLEFRVAFLAAAQGTSWGPRAFTFSYGKLPAGY